MAAVRTTVLTVFGAAAVGALAGVAFGAMLDDPEPRVSAVELAAGAAPDDTATGASTPTSPPATTAETTPTSSEAVTQQVPGLDELSGTVTRDPDDDGDGDDPDDLAIGRVDLEFGPDRWVATAGPSHDYDGDGTAEPLRDELDGLVGTEATLRVRFDDDGDDADVYLINGLPYRDITGPPPWLSADAVDEERIRAAAAAAVGEGARVVDLEAEAGTAVAWEAEVVDRDGREHDVLLDAAGRVIDVRAD